MERKENNGFISKKKIQPNFGENWLDWLCFLSGKIPKGLQQFIFHNVLFTGVSK